MPRRNVGQRPTAGRSPEALFDALAAGSGAGRGHRLSTARHSQPALGQQLLIVVRQKNPSIR